MQRGTCLEPSITPGVRTCRMVYHSETNLQSHPYLIQSCSDSYTLTFQYHQNNICSIFHWTRTLWALCGRPVNTHSRGTSHPSLPSAERRSRRGRWWVVARRSTNGRSCGCAAGMRVIVIAPTTVTVIQRMLIQPVAYLWEIVSSIKRNCFKTSDLLNKTTFGRAPKFFLYPETCTYICFLICSCTH